MARIVAEMTAGELKRLVGLGVEEKLIELLGDPDEGLALGKSLPVVDVVTGTNWRDAGAGQPDISKRSMRTRTQCVSGRRSTMSVECLPSGMSSSLWIPAMSE